MENNHLNNQIDIGDTVTLPSGRQDVVCGVDEGLYWLDSGLYAYRFEIKLFAKGDKEAYLKMKSELKLELVEPDLLETENTVF